MIKKLIAIATILLFLATSITVVSAVGIAGNGTDTTSSAITETFYFCKIESSCDRGQYIGLSSSYVWLYGDVNASTMIKSLFGLRTLFSIDGDHELDVTFFFGKKNFAGINIGVGWGPLSLKGLALKVEVTYNS